MSVYRTTDVVGTSKTSFDEAIRLAVEKAAFSVSTMAWFEVKEMRGTVSAGSIQEYQVRLTVGFRIED